MRLLHAEFTTLPVQSIAVSLARVGTRFSSVRSFDTRACLGSTEERPADESRQLEFSHGPRMHTKTTPTTDQARRRPAAVRQREVPIDGALVAATLGRHST